MISVTELFYNSFSTARESGMEADDTHAPVRAEVCRRKKKSLKFQHTHIF